MLAENFGLGYPAFMYLEGSDQHRGWFQSSILTAVGTTGTAPFETVLTHGFVVDDKGEKMSKSLGNVVLAVKATEQYGADVLRLMVASMDYADDIRISERGIKETSESYRKIRNTFRYLLGNLEDYARFDPASFDAAWLHEFDLWALGQLNQVIRDVTAAYERFEFYRVCQRIYQFVSVELEPLPRRAQGPPLCRVCGQPRPSSRPVRPGPAARRPDPAAGPDHSAHGRGVVGLPAGNSGQAGKRPPGRFSWAGSAGMTRRAMRGGKPCLKCARRSFAPSKA